MSRLLNYQDLRERGISFCKLHLDRLAKDGYFPKPIKIGRNTKAWLESEIEAYLAERAAARTGATWQPAVRAQAD
jgi:prophage regulatory protein